MFRSAAAPRLGRHLSVPLAGRLRQEVHAPLHLRHPPRVRRYVLAHALQPDVSQPATLQRRHRFARDRSGRRRPTDEHVGRHAPVTGVARCLQVLLLQDL